MWTRHPVFRNAWDTGESTKGHRENANESSESAGPNGGCALSYIKATFPQKRLHLGADLCASGWTKSADCVCEAG